ncbi:MAG: CerR family C-terminal domain-containing protein [Deltaproteobacteria bacterium]|nr:CerR family C-terminal domain-containing protein [Deltaproteobacteria bacterium]MBW2170885.1 CerR family C-terminal domain-containing protein [Deltaproteobacteria bacterium]
MSKADNHDLTKDRLLDEAEALFARKGYDAVSVREITNAACCNLAAVNYHFGNKKNLYLEVFRARWIPRARRLQESFKKSLDGEEVASPRAVARALAEAFLVGPLSDEERFRHHQLMVRELSQSTEALELVVDEVMRPFFKKLAGMLRPSMPEESGTEHLMLNILSMFAMVLHFNFARAAVTRVTGREYTEAFKNRLVEHITEFSLTGLGVGEDLH